MTVIESRSSNRNIVLLSSRLPFEDRIYAIGAFAARVSFASQQRRAFNVAWAIDEDLRLSGEEKGVEGKRVFVVGAGLAGYTSALVLAGLGAEVTLFEKEKEPFHYQSKAFHRHIHPSINFWPFSPLDVHTSFPILNWCRSTCPDVVAMFNEKWEKLNRAGDSPRVDVKLYHEVVEFEKERNHLKVTVETFKDVKKKNGGTHRTSQGRTPKTCDILLLATGMGKEIKEFGTPIYWDQTSDVIDDIVAGDHEYGFENYVVCGTGDGGLIEVFRLLFTDGDKNIFQDEDLDVLGDPDLKEKVRIAEHRVRHAALDCSLHAEHSAADGEVSEFRQRNDEICNQLQGEYLKISDHKSAQKLARDLMKDRSSPVDEVILLGLGATPFDPRSAPFHKLLLAIAMKEKLVRYAQITRKPTTTETDEHTRARLVQLDIAKGCDTDVGERLPRSFFLARFGPKSDLDAIIEEPSLSSFRNVQAFYSEYDDLPEKERLRIAEIFDVPPMSDKEGWARHHLPDVRKYFYGKCVVELAPRSNGDGSGPDLCFRLKRLPEASGGDTAALTDKQWRDLQSFPSRMFGLEVDSSLGAQKKATLGRFGYPEH